MNSPTLFSLIIIIVLFSYHFSAGQDVSLQLQVGGSKVISQEIGFCSWADNYQVIDNTPSEIGYQENQLIVNPDWTVFAQFTIAIPLTTTPGIYNGNIVYQVSQIDASICLIDTLEVEVEVIPAQIPVPNFSASPEATVQGGIIQFTNLTENTVTDFLWEFGDGATSTMANPMHSYLFPGIYTVSLTAIGPAGSATETKIDFIQIYEVSTPGLPIWTFETEEAILSSPAIDSDGTIYIGSNSGHLHAINPDGTEKWAFDTDGYAFTPVLGSSGTIYTVSHLFEMYAINPDGTEKWKYEAFSSDGYINLFLALGLDETIYYGTSDGKLYALDSMSNVLWNIQLGGDYSKASYPTIGTDGCIYITSEASATQDALYAINPDGSIKWVTEFIHDLGIEKNKISIAKSGDIYVTNGGRVAAFNQMGELRWYFPDEDQNFRITSEVVCDENGNLYFGGTPGGNTSKLYCLDIAGQLNWEIDVTSYIPTSGTSNEVSTPVIGNNGNLYFYVKGGVVFAVDASGVLLWHLPVVSESFQPNNNFFDDAPALGADGTLYFGYDDGLLHAISTESGSSQNNEWSMQGQNNSNTRSYQCPFPYLNAPLDSAQYVTNAPTFTWSSNLGAIAYEIQISMNDDFSFSHTQTVSETQTQFIGINSGKYFWRVRPIFENGELGCWSASRNFTTGPINSLEESKHEHNIEIYPNPAKNFIVVELESLISTDIEIAIYNSQGNCILLRNQKVRNGNNLIKFNTSSLLSGSYYFHITGKNLQWYGKFVII